MKKAVNANIMSSALQESLHLPHSPLDQLSSLSSQMWEKGHASVMYSQVKDHIYEQLISK